MNLIPQSPVLNSRRAKLLNIIGPDCYRIIEDYKESIERYEKNFKDIDECINKQDSTKKYDMTINLEEFRNYCLKNKYKINIEFKIKMGQHINFASYSLDYLKPVYLKHIKIKHMKYKERYDGYPWIELYFGEHNIDSLGSLEKILINTIFTFSPRQRYSGGLEESQDRDYMDDFFKKYIKLSENIENLIL